MSDLIRSIGSYARAITIETGSSDLERSLVEEPMKVEGHAALLIDMQSYFLGYINKKIQEKIIAAQMNVLGFCKDYDIPVLVLEYQGYSETVTELRDLVEQVPRSETKRKSHDNGFTNQDVAPLLHSWDIERVILIGINANACVKSTARGALKNDLKICTAGDIIAHSNPQSYHKSLDFFRKHQYFDTHQKLLEMLT